MQENPRGGLTTGRKREWMPKDMSSATFTMEEVGAFDKWALKKNIREEVEYALNYSWHRSMSRLEARSYIEHYGPNDVWLWKTMYM